MAVNSDKTERTKLKRETKKEDETWRSTKKLGTLLGDYEEMRTRKQLAAVSFNNLWRIWSRKNNKISIERRLRLYDAYITPILTYNGMGSNNGRALRTRSMPPTTPSKNNRDLLSAQDLERRSLQKMQHERARTHHTKCHMAHAGPHSPHERRHPSQTSDSSLLRSYKQRIPRQTTTHTATGYRH